MKESERLAQEANKAQRRADLVSRSGDPLTAMRLEAEASLKRTEARRAKDRGN